MQGTNDEASNLSYGNIQGLGQNQKVFHLGSKIDETYYPDQGQKAKTNERINSFESLDDLFLFLQAELGPGQEKSLVAKP
jgi:hypothetical protein